MHNELDIQIEKALSALVLQGKAALRCFKLGLIGQGMDVLKEREFSFHNFRYADLTLLRRGVDIAKSPEYKESINELLRVNKDLEKFFSEEKKRQSASLNSIKFSSPVFQAKQDPDVKRFSFNIGI